VVVLVDRGRDDCRILVVQEQIADSGRKNEEDEVQYFSKDRRRPIGRK
jgi:hypothetical protein